jgi:1-acyl-sn-glycerol-3-phosphate acyltransferase
MQLSGQEYVDLYAADIKKGKEQGVVKPPTRLPEAIAS